MATVILYNPKERMQFKVPYLPFSLMTVGTSLKKAGFEVIIIDGRIEKETKKKIAEALKKNPLFFGMTVMTGSMIYDALEVARLVKEINAGIPIVVGGVHPSLLPEETVNNILLDIVVIGPGEKAAVEIARSIETDTPFDALAGIAYKDNHRIVMHARENAIDPSFFAEIDYTLVNIERYIKREASGDRCLDYLSSRGCPHCCTYCSVAKVWGRRMIMYSSKDMVDTIERLVKDHNINAFHFSDDNFFVNKKRIDEFCDEIIRRNIHVRFWAMCRINYFVDYDDMFLSKLKRAGFHVLNFGAESGSQYILDKIKKDISVNQIIAVAKKCHDYGFRGQFSFMMKFPFEKQEDLEATMRMIDRIHAINNTFDCQLFPFIPFPDTDLFYECQEYGFTSPNRIEDWADFEYGNITMPWLSAQDKKHISTLTTIAWFGFTSETSMKLGIFTATLFEIFGAIARLRWKYRAFRFPIEWKIVNFLARH